MTNFGVYIYIYKRKEKIKKARKMLLDHKSHGFIDYLTLK
jgi:arsenate reductase-like glutaredoxin family protein